MRDLAFDIGVMKCGVFISVQGKAADEFEDFSKTSYLRNVKKGDWIEELKNIGFNEFEVYKDYGAGDSREPQHLDIVAVK